MTIQEIVAKIRTAVFGREVRTAIADGIEKIYDDALNSNNTNVEVVDARGSFDTLGDRLTATDNEIIPARGTFPTLDNRLDATDNSISSISLNLAAAESAIEGNGDLIDQILHDNLSFTGQKSFKDKMILGAGGYNANRPQKGIDLDSGTQATPPIRFLTGNNKNWGMDSLNGEFRIGRNFNENAGSVDAKFGVDGLLNLLTGMLMIDSVPLVSTGTYPGIGYWIKFANGTIVQLRNNYSSGTALAANSAISIELTFPEVFVQYPPIVVPVGPWAPTKDYIGFVATKADYSKVGISLRTGATSQVFTDIGYIAIGRWK